MIARALKKHASELSAEEQEHYKQYVRGQENYFSVGQEYPVYGVLFRQGVPWFLICERDNDKYPTPHFGVFFELADCQIPPYWSLALGPSNVGKVALLPDQWAKDSSFLERLVDEDQQAIADFFKLKERMKQWHRGV